MKLKKAGAFTVITKPYRIRIEKERIEDILVQAELEIKDDKVKINSLKINSQDISIKDNNNYELYYNHQTITVKGNNLNLKNTIYLLISIINKISNKSAEKIDTLLSSIESKKSGFWVDISKIVKNFNDSIDFQQNIVDEKEGLFQKYKLSELETTQNFITIDPSIIQLMIFDNVINQIEDKVYSLKLIKRKEQNKLTFRYTTRLFPNGSRITHYNKLETFKNFNNNLDITYETQTDNNNKSFMVFLKKYLKFYNFYKKCYLIPDTKPSKKIVDYQLRYISILGKARFGDTDLKKRTGIITEYIMSNLLFMNPTYAFISGGYKGFKHEKYGVTRSGYEMAKRYNRPILTIMCKEGLFDSHLYSDATYIYGEHWGEDSIALSQFSDGAIIIAPFGGWTYIECLTLLKNRKIVGIYNNFFNILNIDKPENNENFFKFAPSEQDSILNYYINYYLILLFLIYDSREKAPYNGIYECIDYILKLLFLLKNNKDKFKTNNVSLILKIINEIKKAINNFVSINLEAINKLFKKCCNDHSYQINIPENCDGIWIKPSFNLSNCIEESRNGGYCTHDIQKIKSRTYFNSINIDKSISIDIEMLKKNLIFTNLNLNIIFVFSDVYSLNIYLKEKLNSSEYQTLLQKKIDELEQSSILLRNISRSLSYNRNMDSSFDEESGVINKEIKLRDKYEFFIEEKCNNYKLIEDYDDYDDYDDKHVSQTQLKKQEEEEIKKQIENQINDQNEVRTKLENKEKEIIINAIQKYPELSQLGDSFYSRTSRNLFKLNIRDALMPITRPRSSRSGPVSATTTKKDKE